MPSNKLNTSSLNSVGQAAFSNPFASKVTTPVLKTSSRYNPVETTPAPVLKTSSRYNPVESKDSVNIGNYNFTPQASAPVAPIITKTANSTPVVKPNIKSQTFSVGAGMTPVETAKAKTALKSEMEIAKSEIPIQKNPAPIFNSARDEQIANEIEKIDAGKNPIYNNMVKSRADQGHPMTFDEQQKFKYEIAKSKRIEDMAIGATSGLQKTVGQTVAKNVARTIEGELVDNAGQVIKQPVEAEGLSSLFKRTPKKSAPITVEQSTPGLFKSIAAPETTVHPAVSQINDFAPEASAQQAKAGEGIFNVTPSATKPVEPQSLFTAPETKEVPVESLAPVIEKPPIENKSLQQTILDAKAQYDTQQRSNEEPPVPTEFPQEVEAIRREMANSPILDNIKSYKDISTVKTQFRDIYRNTKEVFGKDSVVADKILLEPLNRAKSNYIDFLNKETTDLANNIKIGKGTEESEYIQLYGEGKATLDELVKKFGEKKSQEIVAADTFFRTKYNNSISKLNAVEQQIYPNSPYKWTPTRADYYRHFSEAKNSFSRLQNILDNPIKIDPLLVGITETTEPKSKWASFKQRRNTEITKADAVGGYLDYLKSASFAINIDPQIGRIREFADVLKRGTGIKKNLNNYIQNLTNVANELSGKTHILDRAVMETIPGGRRGLATLNWLNNRVKANTILMNVKSAMAQILNVPQGLASAGPINSSKGAAMTLAQIFNNKGPQSKSTFLKERFFHGFSQFDKGILANTKKFSIWMVGALDEVGTKVIWNGQYQKALSSGAKNPVKFADDATRSLVAGRGIAEKPSIQSSQVFQLLAPFQYEMTNVWWIMEDIAKSDKKLAGKIGQFMMFFVAVYITDNIFEKVTGGRPLFDPIEATIDAIKEIESDPGLTGYVKGGGRLFGEALSNLPMGSTLAQSYPEFGENIGGAKLPTRKEFFGSADPTRFGEGLLSTKALSDPLFKVLPSYGGGQIKKTLQGLTTVDQGKSTTASGATQYKVDTSFRNYLQGALLGKYALPETVNYYKKQAAPKPVTGSSNRSSRYNPV